MSKSVLIHSSERGGRCSKQHRARDTISLPQEIKGVLQDLNSLIEVWQIGEVVVQVVNQDQVGPFFREQLDDKLPELFPGVKIYGLDSEQQKPEDSTVGLTYRTGFLEICAVSIPQALGVVSYEH